jgi:hypothetical protein
MTTYLNTHPSEAWIGLYIPNNCYGVPGFTTRKPAALGQHQVASQPG